MLRLIPSILSSLFSQSFIHSHTQPLPLSVIYTQPAPQYFALSLPNYLFSSLSETPCQDWWGHALFFSFQAWVSYWGPCLISIWFPCSPVAADCSSLCLYGTLMQLLFFPERLLFQQIETMRRKSISDDIQSRRLLRMNENFKCLLCIPKLMFHLGKYADQQEVLKLFIAGAERHKSTVLLLRYVPFTVLFPLEER